MPKVIKTNSAKQSGLSSRPKRPRKRAGRDETSRICAVQRTRMLSAAARVIDKHGYNGLTVARITSGASVSRRTFYQQFGNREECFLELFDMVVARAAKIARDATMGQTGWRERVRAGLAVLLVFLEDEPELGSLLVVDALAAGPTVLERRAGWLDTLAGILDRGRGEARAGDDGPPPLTAEGLVGAVLSVIHARLVEQSAHPGTESESSRSDERTLEVLLNPLMGMIVLPYLGKAAAAKELARTLPQTARSSSTAAPSARRRNSSADPLEGLEMRLTYRTLRVLSAVAATPGASNRQVADAAGVHDQGQMSKLLGRLERLGLVRNNGDGQPRGEPNAWTLTPRGTDITRTITTQQP